MKRQPILQLTEPPFPPLPPASLTPELLCFQICDDGFLHNTPVTKGRDKKNWYEVYFILAGFQPMLVGSRLFVWYYVTAIVATSLACPPAKIIVVAAFFFHYLVFPLLSAHWQGGLGLHYLYRNSNNYWLEWWPLVVLSLLSCHGFPGLLNKGIIRGVPVCSWVQRQTFLPMVLE